MAKVTRLSFDQGDDLERRRLHLREISPELDAPLETVGQDLRAARQRKGEDLASVSQYLKIRKDHLNALEEGHFDQLPGRAYAVGFVRGYANYLGLEVAALVERYKAEIAGFDQAEEAEACLAPEIGRKFPQGTAVFVALLVIGVAYGGYYLQSSANQILTEREAVIPPRLEAIVTEQAVDAGIRTIAPVEAQIDAAAQAEAANPVVTTAETVENAPSMADISLAAQNLPAGQAYGTRNAVSRITLRIHDTTNVRIVGANDTLFINRTLSPGDTYQTPDVPGMRISAANSGGVELLLDGKSLGFLGASGVEANALSLSPEDIVDRAQ